MALTITDGVALLKRLAGTSLGMLTSQLGGKTNVISNLKKKVCKWKDSFLRFQLTTGAPLNPKNSGEIG